MTEDTGALGIPHESDAEGDTFTGSDPNADVGEPDDLGGTIGIPAPPD
jgi:hypothetical protein